MKFDTEFFWILDLLVFFTWPIRRGRSEIAPASAAGRPHRLELVRFFLRSRIPSGRAERQADKSRLRRDCNAYLDPGISSSSERSRRRR